MNEKIIQNLIETGRLDNNIGARVLETAKKRNVPADRILFEENLVSEIDVVKAKSAALGMPYKPLTIKDVDVDLMSLIPAETARTYRVVPISRKENLLVIGAEYPSDVKTQEALRFIAKEQRVDLGVYVVGPSLVDAVLKKYSPFLDEINTALVALQASGRLSTRRSRSEGLVTLEGDRTVVAGEAPIIKIVTKFLEEAVREGASDIHFESGRTQLRVRFRIDGQLKEVAALPFEIHAPVISRLKILAKLKIDETRVPQDGRFRAEIFDREVDFRVATFPTPFGEKVALRVLDPSVGLKGLHDLGVSEHNVAILNKAIAEPYGEILVTGPTGSGKTTTLYALMQILNKEDVNIVSLEDPVEYSIQGINQSQVKPEIGYTFASGLRQILRQDPDVIMIGEIRDRETAELATHAALTGHIVLSTLHTNNAIGVLPRLIDLDVPPFLLSSTINSMVAQRLLGKLCEHCRQPVEKPDTQALALVQREIEALPADLKKRYQKITFYRAPGCSQCGGRGRIGRIAVMEVFKMTPELSDLISQGLTETKLFEIARLQAMVTMRQDGIMKAIDGLLTIEEVLRETADSQ
jgi:type IV pilus assembly protein PilB